MENPRNSEGTIRTIKWICLIACVLEIAFVAVYFFVFSGGISTANQDWDTFTHIFNGLIMAILTTANIYIFYKLTKAIEDKNQERAIKEKVFEAQSVITQMRVRQYEEVSTLIYDVLACVAQRKKDNGEFTLLMKKMTEIDNSLLFKNYHLEEPSMLSSQSLVIVENYKKLTNDFNDANFESLCTSLSAYQKLMETHIVGQMIIDNDVEAYVRDKNNNLDCTISCVKQVLECALKELEEQEYIEAK